MHCADSYEPWLVLAIEDWEPVFPNILRDAFGAEFSGLRSRAGYSNRHPKTGRRVCAGPGADCSNDRSSKFRMGKMQKQRYHRMVQDDTFKCTGPWMATRHTIHEGMQFVRHQRVCGGDAQTEHVETAGLWGSTARQMACYDGRQCFSRHWNGKAGKSQVLSSMEIKFATESDMTSFLICSSESAESIACARMTR